MSRLRKIFGAANRERLATYLLALWKLFTHPETPRAAKLVAVAVLAYAVSPIDLIPDFIPVLGMLDELVLIPLGIALVLKLTPQPLWEARLREAEASHDKLPKLVGGAVVIVIVWLVVLGLAAWGLARWLGAA